MAGENDRDEKRTGKMTHIGDAAKKVLEDMGIEVPDDKKANDKYSAGTDKKDSYKPG